MAGECKLKGNGMKLNNWWTIRQPWCVNNI